jgi:hypothetical protein
MKIIFPIAIACLVLSFPSWASAQTRVSGSDFRTREIRDETLLRAGRISIFFSATGGWAYGSTSPDNGPERTQNTVFSLPSLGGGYMVTDNLQVRVVINGIFVFAGIDGARTQETYGVGGAVQGLYHIELAQGMALYAGIGAGGFYSTRTDPTTAGLVRFTGGGFQGQVPVGLLLQPGASLFLRGGLRLDVLVGSESPEDASVSMASSTLLNVFTNAELAVGFRF